MLFRERGSNREEVAKVGCPIVQKQHSFDRGVWIGYDPFAGLERYDRCLLHSSLIGDHGSDCWFDETRCESKADDPKDKWNNGVPSSHDAGNGGDDQEDVREEADDHAVPACFIPTKFGVCEISAKQGCTICKEGKEHGEGLGCLKTEIESTSRLLSTLWRRTLVAVRVCSLSW